MKWLALVLAIVAVLFLGLFVLSQPTVRCSLDGGTWSDTWGCVKQTQPSISTARQDCEATNGYWADGACWADH